MSDTPHDLLERIVAPVVERAGLDLESLDISSAGRRSRVRVIVDADGGVDLDRCADVSRHIAKVLDDTDAMGATAYTLEVSSPGVSRPLTEPRHWQRAVGRLVKAVLTDGGSVTGRVASVGDDHVVLDVDGADRQLAFAEVAKARVQVEFRKVDDDAAGEG